MPCAAHCPGSPVEANAHFATNTGSLVYPPKKVEEIPQPPTQVKQIPKIDVRAVAQKCQPILPCAECKHNADSYRQSQREKGIAVPVQGEADPYAATTNKKRQQMAVPVNRVCPNKDKHAEPGPAPVRRVRPGAHNPYAPACHDGICTGLCFEGICNGGAPWDGKCIEQDICKMLGPGKCICHLTEAVPKHMVICLDWVNCGKCDPTQRGLEMCPFAHPDLTRVHSDVCSNHLLTGFCRFHKNGQEKKNNRIPCKRCHCAAPENGAYPLLPGVTKKILRPLAHEGHGADRKVVEWDCTDLDRALAPYKVLLGLE